MQLSRWLSCTARNNGVSPGEGGAGPLEPTKDKKTLERGRENDDVVKAVVAKSAVPLPERYIESRKWNIECRLA